MKPKIQDSVLTNEALIIDGVTVRLHSRARIKEVIDDTNYKVKFYDYPITANVHKDELSVECSCCFGQASIRDQSDLPYCKDCNESQSDIAF